MGNGTNRAKQFVTIDLGEKLPLEGFTYLPSQDRWAFGTIKRYVFEVSTNGENWSEVSEGEFGNIANNPIQQTIYFKTKHLAKYIRFRSVEVVDASNAASFGEIGVLTVSEKNK